MNKTLITLLSCMLLGPSAHFVYGVDPSMPDMHKVTVVMEEKIMSDIDIMASVKDVIAKDIVLGKFSKDIDVKVDKGVVTLGGKVDSVKVKDDLGLLVKGIVGVKSVVNNIEVQSLMMK